MSLFFQFFLDTNLNNLMHYENFYGSDNNVPIVDL